MADIFVSYKREDEDRVAPIVNALTSSGFSVWWDRAIPGGESWRQTIVEQLDSASCVIVVWSHLSAGPSGAFVQDEAGRAKSRGVLLPIRIDSVSPPLGFGDVQTLDLVGWHGQPRDRRIQDIIAAARAVVSGGPRPRPSATAPRLRVATLVTAAIATGGAALAFAGDIAGVQSGVCRFPGIRTACAAFGFGTVATSAEEALWAARKPGDCGGLREYISRFPRGAYAAEAGRRLQAADSRREPRIEHEQRRLPVTVRPTLSPLTTEEEARADALARAPADAKLLCDGFNAAGSRVTGMNVEPSQWRCTRRDRGVVCGFDGNVICDVEMRQVQTIEICQ
jgi:hypothetical protein